MYMSKGYSTWKIRPHVASFAPRQVLLVMDYVAGGAILESSQMQAHDRLTEGAARKYMRDVLLVRYHVLVHQELCWCWQHYINYHQSSLSSSIIMDAVI